MSAGDTSPTVPAAPPAGPGPRFGSSLVGRWARPHGRLWATAPVGRMAAGTARTANLVGRSLSARTVVASRLGPPRPDTRQAPARPQPAEVAIPVPPQMLPPLMAWWKAAQTAEPVDSRVEDWPPRTLLRALPSLQRSWPAVPAPSLPPRGLFRVSGRGTGTSAGPSTGPNGGLPRLAPTQLTVRHPAEVKAVGPTLTRRDGPRTPSRRATTSASPRGPEAPGPRGPSNRPASGSRLPVGSLLPIGSRSGAGSVLASWSVLAARTGRLSGFDRSGPGMTARRVGAAQRQSLVVAGSHLSDGRSVLRAGVGDSAPVRPLAGAFGRPFARPADSAESLLAAGGSAARAGAIRRRAGGSVAGVVSGRSVAVRPGAGAKHRSVAPLGDSAESRRAEAPRHSVVGWADSAESSWALRRVGTVLAAGGSVVRAGVLGRSVGRLADSAESGGPVRRVGAVLAAGGSVVRAGVGDRAPVRPVAGVAAVLGRSAVRLVDAAESGGLGSVRRRAVGRPYLGAAGSVIRESAPVRAGAAVAAVIGVSGRPVAGLADSAESVGPARPVGTVLAAGGSVVRDWAAVRPGARAQYRSVFRLGDSAESGGPVRPVGTVLASGGSVGRAGVGDWVPVRPVAGVAGVARALGRPAVRLADSAESGGSGSVRRRAAGRPYLGAAGSVIRDSAPVRPGAGVARALGRPVAGLGDSAESVGPVRRVGTVLAAGGSVPGVGVGDWAAVRRGVRAQHRSIFRLADSAESGGSGSARRRAVGRPHLVAAGSVIRDSAPVRPGAGVAQVVARSVVGLGDSAESARVSGRAGAVLRVGVGDSAPVRPVGGALHHRRSAAARGESAESSGTHWGSAGPAAVRGQAPGQVSRRLLEVQARSLAVAGGRVNTGPEVVAAGVGPTAPVRPGAARRADGSGRTVSLTTGSGSGHRNRASAADPIVTGWSAPGHLGRRVLAVRTGRPGDPPRHRATTAAAATTSTVRPPSSGPRPGDTGRSASRRGQRFLETLARHRPDPDRAIPVQLRRLAELEQPSAAVAPDILRKVKVRSGPGARAALAAAGRPAATVGDTIYLSRPPDRSTRSAEILAHELVHAARPSPRPRFFADDQHSAEETAAVRAGGRMAGLMRTFEKQTGRPTAPEHLTLGTAGLAVGPGASPLTSGAAAAAGGPGRSATVTPPEPRHGGGRRSQAGRHRPGPTPPEVPAVGLVGAGTPPGDLVARIQRSIESAPAVRPGTRPPAANGGAPAANGGASGDPFNPKPGDRPFVRTLSASGGTMVYGPPDTESGPAGTAERGAPISPETLDWIVEAVEERILAELERRGTRYTPGVI